MCAIIGGMDKDYNKLKKIAEELRKTGLSYNEIKNRVGVAKSTLSLWLKSTPLSEKHRRRLYTKQIQILSRGPKSQQERRRRDVEKIIKTTKEEVAFLKPETIKLIGAALYWAEGDKSNMLAFTNSDPNFILFMVRWLEKVFDSNPKDLKARLNIYPQQNELKIKRFWASLTGIPVKNFGKSYVKPPNKGYKKNNLYYGTIKIAMPKSVDSRYRVFGWIEGIIRAIAPEVKSVKSKWQSLAKTPRPINLK